MKKILAYMVMLILFASSILLYRAATNEAFFTKVEESGLVRDIYRYGDMYTNTNLPDFKVESALDTLIQKYEPSEMDSQITLHIIGDSYTQPGRVDAKNFSCGFYQYGFDRNAEKLDSTKRNILIIEKTERYLRLNVKDALALQHKVPSTQLNEFLSRNPNPDWFNTSKINERLQYLISNHPLAFFMQEQKATFNNAFLGFTGNGVYVSSKTHLVYLSETIDSTINHSPYNAVSSEEENQIIDYLNSMYDEYKVFGFDEIYFSLIPEKIRVYPVDTTWRFNTLFSILNNPHLKMSLIHCLNELQKSPQQVFMTCDTHWNTNGINIWLKKVEEVIHPQ